MTHGLTIMVFASAFGDVSGGHINPAVTIGLAAAGEFPRRHVAPYIAEQVGGAVAAVYCLLAVFGGPVNHLDTTLVDRQRITDGRAFALVFSGSPSRLRIAQGQLPACRIAPLAAEPTRSRNLNEIIQAFYDGIHHKPATTFSKVKAEVLDGKHLDFRPTNSRGVIRGLRLSHLIVPQPRS